MRLEQQESTLSIPIEDGSKQAGLGLAIKSCKNCGGPLIGRRSKSAKTCSDACMSEVISKGKLGDKNPMRRADVAAKVSATIKAGYSDYYSTALKERWKQGKIKSRVPTLEQRQAISLRMKLNNPMKRKDVAARMGATLRESCASGAVIPFMCTPEGKRRISEIATKKMLSKLNPMKDPAIVQRVFDQLHRTPNGFESRVIQFVIQYELPFRYTGDYSFWVPCKSGRRKNPDFIHVNTKAKKAILAHGRYWHRFEEEVQEEKADYASRGWQCFVIWDDELLDEAMAQRVLEFAGVKSNLLPTSEQSASTI